MSLPTAPRVSSHYRRRLRGEERVRVARQLAQEYAAGSSIRGVASGADLSYGTARLLLLEAKVSLRRRGGRVARTAGR